ncbi:MAG: hypothetical protein HC768_21090 [Acaryochloris sp. CRU_2_0]|nr:hypothetical protein [Acaryochloris sp. CRU_2_0]
MMTPKTMPSYEKLINSIYAFAESKSRTTVLDLRELQPQDRWRQQLETDPDRMWQKYSAGLNPRDKGAFTYQVVARALRANHTDESIKAMLTRDPQYQVFVRNHGGNRDIAEHFANLIVKNAKKMVAASQAKGQQTPRQQRSQQIDHGPSLGM